MYYYNKDRSVITSNSSLKSRNLVDRTALINRKLSYTPAPTTTITAGVIGSNLTEKASKPILDCIVTSEVKDFSSINAQLNRNNTLRYTWLKQPIKDTVTIKNVAVWYSPTEILESETSDSRYYEIHVPYGQLCDLPVITSNNGTIITKTTYDIMIQNNDDDWISIFYCCPDLLQHYYIYDTYCVLQLKNSTSDLKYNQNIMIKVNPLNSYSLPITHFMKLPLTQSTTDITSATAPEPFLLRLDDNGTVLSSEKLDADYNYIYTCSDKISL